MNLHSYGYTDPLGEMYVVALYLFFSLIGLYCSCLVVYCLVFFVCIYISFIYIYIKKIFNSEKITFVEI
jgi:hypothetical protein